MKNWLKRNRVRFGGLIARGAGGHPDQGMQPLPRLQDPGLEADFDRDGYAVVPALLDEYDTAHLLEVFRANDDPIHRLPFAATLHSGDLGYRAVIDREVRAVVWPKLEPLLNGYRYCFATFVSKEPGTPAPGDAGEVSLHQDIAFVDESRYESLGLWCPLTDVDEVNGCLLVAPGSQRLNQGPRGPGTPFPYRELLPLFRRKLRPLPMAAGGAVLFSQKLFHASRPNRGAAPRVVAGGLLAPRGAQLYCYYPDPSSDGRMEVFEIDDLFYTRYTYRSRPEGVPRVGAIEYWHAPLSAQDLAG